MPDTFAITTTSTVVPLDAQRRGQASFTVSNVTGRALRGRARIVPANPAAAPWLAIAGDSERDFPVAGTQQYTVQIAPPPGAPPGSYSFHLDVVGVEDPDDELNAGPSLTFAVPAPAPPPAPFPWWIAVVVGVVLLALGGVAILVVSNPACFALPAGLTSWYSGDGNTTDRLGGPAGTAHGGISFSPGEVGQAISFNGTDSFVDFGPTANFGASDFTIEFWINTAAPRQAGIIGNRNDGCSGSGGQWLDLRTLNDGSVLFELKGEANGGTLNSAPNRLGDGRLHHLAAVRAGTRMGLYIDGQLDQFISIGAVSPLNNTTPLIAGKSACTGRDRTGFLAGQLDEISIYKRALTAQEIQRIFQAGSMSRCPLPAR